MSEKRENRKKEILKKALDVWKFLPGKERSMSLLADACGMTKQAFYRYFSNKQEIIDSLQQKLAVSLEENNKIILSLAAQKPVPVKEILLVSLDFIKTNWDLLVFGMLEGGYMFKDSQKQNRRFYGNLEDCSGIDRHSWLWFFNVIIYSCWREWMLSEELSHQWISLLLEKVTKGFTSGVLLSEKDYAEIDFSKKNLPPMEQEASRIVQAFLELVDEKGIAQLSLQELASKAGMGKSSLYNYFDSKQELEVSILKHMQDDFIERRSDFLKDLEGFAPRLYGHILFLNRYMDDTPAVKVMITELKENRTMPIGSVKPLDINQMLPLFSQGVSQGYMDEDLLPMEDQVRLISFCLGAEMVLLDENEPSEIRSKRIFRLFTEGLFPENKNTASAEKDEIA